MKHSRAFGSIRLLPFVLAVGAFVFPVACIDDTLSRTERAKARRLRAGLVARREVTVHDDDEPDTEDVISALQQPAYGGIAAPPVPARGGKGGVVQAPQAAPPKSGDGSSRFAWMFDPHEVVGALVFGTFFMTLCCLAPLLYHMHSHYVLHHSEGSGFFDYLEYKFSDWFTKNQYAPPLVLIFMTMLVITTGSFAYSALVGGTPSYALYRIFVFTFAASADAETAIGGRFLAIVVTVAGLIILSLLLGIVADTFASKMNEIKEGRNKVVEGGHVVVIGFTESTRIFIEEIAIAREVPIEGQEAGVTIVVLAEQEKQFVEQELWNVQIRNSRLIIRKGLGSSIRDLLKANADASSQVVVLADTTLEKEESDAKTIRVLMTLKHQGWPNTEDGRVIVQCTCEANRNIMQSILGEDKSDIVVVGDIVAKLMVQSSRKIGLANCFGSMLGFEGDEFYAEVWGEPRGESLVGSTFLDICFRMPDAVVVGVLTRENECIFNPPQQYRIEEKDAVIVIAEDDTSYEPVREPYINYLISRFPSPADRTPKKRARRRSQRPPTGPTRVLIIGWNSKIPILLSTLNEMVGAGSTVDIYSPRDEELRNKEVEKMEDSKLDTSNLTLNHLYVEKANFTARTELADLRHMESDYIFVLADKELDGERGADEKTMAIMVQLQSMNQDLEPHVKARFNPVVELSDKDSIDILKQLGFQNIIDSSSLVSQAMAAVTENGGLNAVFGELCVMRNNEFDIMPVTELLDEDEDVPEEISFGELAVLVTQRMHAVPIGWSESPDEEDSAPAEAGPPRRKIILNPKDKISTRPWKEDDRVVVIREKHPQTPRSTGSQSLQPLQEGPKASRGLLTVPTA